MRGIFSTGPARLPGAASLRASRDGGGGPPRAGGDRSRRRRYAADFPADVDVVAVVADDAVDRCASTRARPVDLVRTIVRSIAIVRRPPTIRFAPSLDRRAGSFPPDAIVAPPTNPPRSRASQSQRRRCREIERMEAPRAVPAGRSMGRRPRARPTRSVPSRYARERDEVLRHADV